MLSPDEFLVLGTGFKINHRNVGAHKADFSVHSQMLNAKAYLFKDGFRGRKERGKKKPPITEQIKPRNNHMLTNLTASYFRLQSDYDDFNTLFETL